MSVGELARLSPGQELTRSRRPQGCKLLPHAFKRSGANLKKGGSVGCNPWRAHIPPSAVPPRRELVASRAVVKARRRRRPVASPLKRLRSFIRRIYGAGASSGLHRLGDSSAISCGFRH